MQEIQVQLAAEGEVNAAGEFEILAITAGEGNGWTFGETALQESVGLWEGAECFIDHSWWNRSVRDLGGVLHGVTWSAERRGILAKLKPVGPSAVLVRELGKQMLPQAQGGLGDDGAKPRVGFSADVLFTASGRKVEKILRVQSVDLVFNPARGGVFLRALNSLQEQGVIDMADVVQSSTNNGGGTNAGGANSAGGSLTAQMQQDVVAMQTLLNVQLEREKLAKEAEEARKTREQMCAFLLESALLSAKLPAPSANVVRKQFEGQVFDAEQLNQAIEDQRALAAALTAGLTVQGPGRVHGMFSSEDQLQAAVDDLFGAERDEDKRGVKTARLSGIRELYLMLTGDHDLHGGYDPARLQLATTADFTGLVKNAMNKLVAQQWAELGRAGYEWWRAIATIEHASTLNDLTGILVGTVGDLPSVAEGGDYTELAVGDSPETGSFTKYGGYIPLTLELIDRDETRKLRTYPRQLANAGLRKISSLVAGIFTANAGVGPTLSDTGALFNATAVTTKGGHANLRTTALGAAEWDAVQLAVYNQPMLVKAADTYWGLGPKMAINPRYCLTPRALELTARKVLYPAWENAANIHSENQQQGRQGDVLVVPEWTDATNWAAACDPAIAPAIYIGERFGLMPEIFIAGSEVSPAVFSNDEHRLKVRHFLSVFVADYRPLHKSNVAG